MINVNGGGSTSGVLIDLVNGTARIMVNADKQIQYNAREHNGTTTASLGITSVNMITRSNI